MLVITAAENFHLNLDQRSEIQAAFSDLAKFLRSDSKLRLFFKKETQHLLHATLVLHAGHEELTCSEFGESAVELAHALALDLRERLVHHKELLLERRRKQRKEKYKRTHSVTDGESA